MELVAARARPNTLIAQAFDLKVFFSVVGKNPTEVTSADILAFIRVQRQPRRGAKVVRIENGEPAFRRGPSCGRLGDDRRTARLPAHPR
jgi:integrase/recombinase XerD